MDYRRVRYAQSRLRPMGSPDGLGAYYQTTYTKPISDAGGGTSTVAAYKPISGLGCPCTAASGIGDAAVVPTPAASVSLLSSIWVQLALGAGALFLVSKLLGGKSGAHTANGRRRRKAA